MPVLNIASLPIGTVFEIVIFTDWETSLPGLIPSGKGVMAYFKRFSDTDIDCGYYRDDLSVYTSDMYGGNISSVAVTSEQSDIITQMIGDLIDQSGYLVDDVAPSDYDDEVPVMRWVI